jgi:uncharacterized LabA/DUF88 family protein
MRHPQGKEEMTLLLLFNQGDTVQDTYLYVDGESHFIGTQNCWASIHPGMGIESIVEDPSGKTRDDTGFPFEPRIRLHKKSKFFWDGQLTRRTCHTFWHIHRAVYVTSIVGDDDAEHGAARYIRDSGFDPVIVREDRNLEKSRASELEKKHLVIKPKGVDIALAVRMLEDAHKNLFGTCFLVTSDADYLPLVVAVRALGKQVFVLGYSRDFTKRNPRFEYVPDKCLDIGEDFMRRHYKLDASKAVLQSGAS